MTQRTVTVDGINYKLSYNDILSEEQMRLTIDQIRLQTAQNVISIATGCNKTSAIVGDVLNLSAIPSGGASGTNYTIKFMKKVGSGSEVVLDTKTSTGTEVTYNYTVVSEDNDANVQFWSIASYTCEDDGTTKTGTSTKCNVMVGTAQLLYRCNQTTGQCEPCNGVSAQDCYDDCIAKCGWDFECIMKCIEECENGGTPTPTTTPTTAPCVTLTECQAQCGATSTPTTTPTTTPTGTPTTTPTSTPTTPPTTANYLVYAAAAAVGIGIIYIIYQNRKIK